MKENYDNLGLIIYFFNGQDAGNVYFLDRYEDLEIISFCVLHKYRANTKQSWFFHSVTIFQQYYLSLQYILQYQSFKESCVQGLTGQKKCPFEAKVSFFFWKHGAFYSIFAIYI